MATTMNPPAGQAGLERVRFFPGQILSADDMSLGSEWMLEKLRRHNRYLHGWGIVCGCDVKPPGRTEKPWLLHICPGYLITPQGDEILIASEATFDIAGCILASADPCAMARPCPPITRRAAASSQAVYLAVRYVDCNARPVRVAPVGCSCDDARCEYSRVREAYEFCCLDALPPSAGQKPYGCDHLCKGDVLPCPDCPQEGWVVLATISLPATTDTTVTADQINFTDRRLLYSSAMLREMAICQCGAERPANPPDVTVTRTPTDPPAIIVIGPQGTRPPYVNDVTVRITHPIANAIIDYTVGPFPGTNPGPNSRKYAAPFTVNYAGGRKFAVKARATAPGHTPSGVVEADIEFSNPVV
jgi:hypothetical protein